jgi:predicted metalloprotease with PDZ domain
MNKRFSLSNGYLIFLFSIFGVRATASDMTIAVDFREATKAIIHADITMTAHPGEMQLAFPKWLPGDHMASGPIDNLTGIRFIANSKPLAWHRDPYDPYIFIVNCPPDTHDLRIHVDAIAAKGATTHIHTAGLATTAELAVLNWPLILLYPKGAKLSDLSVSATLQIPEHWTFASALTTLAPPRAEPTQPLSFKEASLAKLADSPVLLGRYFAQIPIPSGDWPPHAVAVASDSADGVKLRADTAMAMERLVAEAKAEFGESHFDRYLWLLALSDAQRTSNFGGQEHHESSDERGATMSLVDPRFRYFLGETIPHEYVHSWSGKFRRPVGEAVDNLNVPIETSLVWVYEGLTTYLANVLAVRSGFWFPEEFRDVVAMKAAAMAHRPGRTWRNLADVSEAVDMHRLTNGVNTSWRRDQDYYDEGFLIWLEIDTIIRERSGGKQSLDDFARKFLGGTRSTGPAVVSYGLPEIVETLMSVVPYDWAGHLNTRLHSYAPEAPLEGLRRAGWQLTYVSNESGMWNDIYSLQGNTLNATYSIGFAVQPDGLIGDVLYGSPAGEAGLASGMHLKSINEKSFSIDALRGAINIGGDIKFSADEGGVVRPIVVTYQGGERYPRLIPIGASLDMFTAILRPRALTPPPSSRTVEVVQP